jgi:cephalosporin-C deacetylase
MDWFTRAGLGLFVHDAPDPDADDVGLRGDICPPSTGCAAYRLDAGPKRLRVWPFNGHEGGATFQTPINLRWLRGISDA